MANLIPMKQQRNNKQFSLPVVILVKRAINEKEIEMKIKDEERRNICREKQEKFYLYKSTDCSCCCNCQHVVILLLLMIMIPVVLFSFFSLSLY